MSHSDTSAVFFPITIGLFARQFPGQADMAGALMIAAGMLGVTIGSFIIGPLRVLFSLAQLYVLAAVYPCIAFVLAAGYLSRQRWKSA